MNHAFDLLENLKIALGNTYLEWIGVLTTLVGIYLTVQGKALCWTFNIISSAIYLYIFYVSKLYADSILQFFFIGISIWGWVNWTKFKMEKKDILPVQHQNWVKFIFSLLISTTLGALIGYFLNKYTQDPLPYSDGICFVWSIYATYLTAIFILENWLVWIITNCFYIFIYIQKSLIPTAILYLLLGVLALIGYFNWKNQVKELKNPLRL